MTPAELLGLVRTALRASPGTTHDRIAAIVDFDDVDICSSAEGIVVGTGRGDQFHITVAQTRYASPHHQTCPVRRIPRGHDDDAADEDIAQADRN
jgi:hypothetical protein